MGRRRNATDTAGRSWASLPCVELVPRRPGQTQQAWYRDQSRELLVNVRTSLTVPRTYDVDSRHVRENNRSVPVCLTMPTGKMSPGASRPTPSRPTPTPVKVHRATLVGPAQPRYENDGGVTFAITQAIAGAALGGLTGFILGRQPLIREREQHDADIKAYQEQIRELEAKLEEGSDASDQADARTGNPTMSLRQMIAMHQRRR
jgi:hypothetical protein